MKQRVLRFLHMSSDDRSSNKPATLNPSDTELLTAIVSTIGTNQIFFDCPHCYSQNQAPRNVGSKYVHTCTKVKCGQKFKVQK